MNMLARLKACWHILTRGELPEQREALEELHVRPMVNLPSSGWFGQQHLNALERRRTEFNRLTGKGEQV